MKGRKVNSIENASARVEVLPGGGHIGSMSLKRGAAAGVNPLWEVPWRSMEPGDFSPERDHDEFGGPPEARLLASIMGHNLCLDIFGPPSPEEEMAGWTVHGEAPVAEWEFDADADSGGDKIGADADLVGKVELPLARISIRRSFSIAPSDPVLRVDTEIRNISESEKRFGWQEHATFGPPFLEKGVTVFDTSATWGCVDPKEVSRNQRLRMGETFTWPVATGVSGEPVDLRVFPDAPKSEDFTTQLMTGGAGNGWAWVTAVNPRLRLMAGYLWRSENFPWLGMWEMNLDRAEKPWSERTLARGFEFGLSPFAHGRHGMLELGRLKDMPVLGTLRAGESMTASFYLFLAEVDDGCRGVSAVERGKESIAIQLLAPGGRIVLSCS